MKTKLLTALAITLSLVALAAQARDTKTVILLEAGGMAPIQCEVTGSKQIEECTKVSESESKELKGKVFVEMRLDPDCAGMAFANNFIDVGSFGKEADYINAVVTFYPTTNENWWWLNIVTINGKMGPDYMSGKASTPKEIAHQLCYIIHQEKVTRR